MFLVFKDLCPVSTKYISLFSVWVENVFFSFVKSFSVYKCLKYIPRGRWRGLDRKICKSEKEFGQFEKTYRKLYLAESDEIEELVVCKKPCSYNEICQQQTRGYAHTAKPCWGMRSLEENSDWRRSLALPLHLIHHWVRRGSWSFPWVFVHDNLAWDKGLAWKMNNTFFYLKLFFIKTRGRQWISHFFLSENTTFIVSSSSKE